TASGRGISACSADRLTAGRRPVELGPTQQQGNPQRRSTPSASCPTKMITGTKLADPANLTVRFASYSAGRGVSEVGETRSAGVSRCRRGASQALAATGAPGIGRSPAGMRISITGSGPELDTTAATAGDRGQGPAEPIGRHAPPSP